MFTMGLYFLMFILLLVSLIKSHEKTLLALKKAWKSFENILPLFLSILFIIGIMLAILSPQVISKIMGHQSGILGLALAALIGSCTVIPGFVTFPLAANLLKNGAGMAQITMLISTSVMVGIITIPIESKYWGKKATYVRNSLALVFSFAIAFVMGVLI
ncbi:permease [Clostridium coskatii]|uniref:Permease n=1 Tax=Clostridium coskatii TaxID=1705578 RepID=A0ABX2WYS1_9CLOT|nr:permease [Clostridium coskatii]OBR97009.1 putative permease [Clostridium coskatii]